VEHRRHGSTQARGVIPQHIDPRLLEVLNRASSLELFQLSTVIERLLADPRRIVAMRKDMHLGQTVRFLDWRDGKMRSGKIVAMKDTQATLHEDGTRREWKLPYTAIEPPPPGGVSEFLCVRRFAELAVG
jgi:hypothetical protein